MAELRGDEIFANNLKRMLFEHRKTATELAKSIGVTKVTVSEWVNGKKQPRMEKVDKICEFFNCSRSDLIDEPKEKEPVSVNTDPQTEIIVKLISRLTPEEKSLAFDYLLSLIQGNQ